MNWFRGQRLVLDVLKGFGDFHNILSISGADKMLCIAGIHRSKLGWATTKGLLKVRMMSVVKSEYGRMMHTSYRRDLMTGLCSIKEGEDVVELCRGYSLHDGGGGEKGAVLVYLLHMRALYR